MAPKIITFNQTAVKNQPLLPDPVSDMDNLPMVLQMLHKYFAWN